jgi:MFS family permease
VLASTLAIAPWFVVLPGRIQASTPNTAYYGLAMAAQGAGSLVGAVLVGQAGDFMLSGTRLCQFASLLGLGCLLAGGASSPSLFVVAGLLFGAGTTSTVIGRTLIQRLTPPGLRSRVTSLLMFTTLGVMPVCYAGAGLVANAAGFAPTLIGGGAVFALCSLAACWSPGVRAIGVSRP